MMCSLLGDLGGAQLVTEEPSLSRRSPAYRGGAQPYRVRWGYGLGRVWPWARYGLGLLSLKLLSIEVATSNRGKAPLLIILLQVKDMKIMGRTFVLTYLWLDKSNDKVEDHRMIISKGKPITSAMRHFDDLPMMGSPPAYEIQMSFLDRSKTLEEDVEEIELVV
ncbi:hypothetical protein Syun_014663 [Stephania yunnanensis]|uniref:Uncharacterized protein n=1 Tax=Stephania yunnanensis TaxID=152371 RepID=A0AAP0JLH3_9MAGN